MEHVVSFPGLGIGEIELNKTAFTIFGRDVAWYGVIITFGIILAVLYVMNRAKYEGIKEDDILDYALFVIPISIIGARVFYVLTTLDQYDSFYDMIAIWEGGLAIYGAIIAGALTSLVISRFKKTNILKLYDMLCPAVMIGQMLGRWGNFMNIEAFGGPTNGLFRMCSPVVTSDFLRKGLVTAEQMADLNSGVLGAHPTFFYESMWSLLGFLLINAYYKRKKYHGEVFFMYITWYGFGRFWIEGLRTDSLYVGPIRISQLIGIVCAIVGGAFLVINYFKKVKGAQPILVAEGRVDEKGKFIKTEKTEEAEADLKEEKTDKTDKEGKDNGKDN